VSAYVLVEIDVTNPEGYAEYAPMAGESVAKHGGRYLARGGRTEPWEGDWSSRIVVVEFESLEAAHAWYYSDDYQAAVGIRQQNSHSRMVAVEGAG
jgi:uncharacterized protein (DUF1330 family)